MSTYAADQYEFIRRREEEIKAERNLALTGSTAPAAQAKVDLSEVGWPANNAVDASYICWAPKV